MKKDSMTLLKAENDRLKNLAQRDGLTGLYNRRTMEERIAHLLINRNEGTMIVLDADKFKSVNDSFGHLEGDYVLKKIAEVLGDMFRSNDLIGRIGGDEFLVFLSETRDEEMVEKRFFRMNSILQETKLFSGAACPVSVTYGYSAVEPDDTYKTLFARADANLIAKKEQRNAIQGTSLHKDNSEESKNISVDIKNIRSDLGEQGKIEGAYLLTYDAFRSVFQFVERGMGRATKKSHIVLFTLVDNRDNFIPLQIRGRHMGLLSETIEKSLRVGDAYTRYSSCQYLVMMINAEEDDVEMIVERIGKSFQNKIINDGSQTVCLNHTIYPMYAVEQREQIPLSS